MKKIFIVALLCAIGTISKAQTNTFPTTGNVGIGTTSPAAKLDVVGDLFVGNQLGGIGGLYIGQAGYQASLLYDTGSGNLHITPRTGYNTIFTAGNVGIGTTTPGALLDINSLGAGYGTAPKFRLTNYLGKSWEIQSGISGVNDNFFGILNATDAIQALTISSNGNVGIGTTTPGSAIQVASYSTASPSAYFYNYAAPGSSRGLVIEGGSNASDYSSDFRNRTGTSLLFIRGDGNVGIGTTAPLSLFQVDDGCSKTSIGDAGGTDLNYGTSYLGFNASRSGASWITNTDSHNNGGGVVYSSIFGDMYFSIIPTTGGSSQTLADANVKSNIAMRIDHLDGAVYAKKIYVQLTGWPDYVFRKDYELMPLAKVKSYIDQNQHLPGLPTDKEVESKGLDVGEMNKLLSKKVEELTLYLIQKDKQIESQEVKLQEQEERLKKIETTLNLNKEK